MEQRAAACLPHSQQGDVSLVRAGVGEVRDASVYGRAALGRCTCSLVGKAWSNEFGFTCLFII
jgi:hypothetical protein